MNDGSQKVTSWFERLKKRTFFKENPAGAGTTEENRANAAQPESGRTAEPAFPSVDGMADPELRSFLHGLSDRDVLRLLQSLSDSEQQLRIVREVSDAAALKRVGRSSLDKKIRKLAERRLREAEGAGRETVQIRQHGLTLRLQEFFRDPRWPKWKHARELLRDASAAELLEQNPGPEYEGMVRRLRIELEDYEKTITEMELLVEQLEPGRARSKRERDSLVERWNALQERFAFTDDFELVRQFKERLEPAAPPPVRKPAPEKKPELPPQPDPEELVRKAEEARKAAEARRGALDRIMTELKEAEERLAQPKTEGLLRQLQKDLQELRRWRKEFEGKWEEAEAFSKALWSRRGEAVQEAQWSAWARTEQAVRIKGELEARLTAIEAEADVLAALALANGLGQSLYDTGRSMRELGSLERGKDHQIWEQFKALSDRGWALCDKLRLQGLELLKTIVSEQLVRPVEFSSTVLANPRTPVSFRPGAFEEAVAERVKALHLLWTQVGGRKSKENQETDLVFVRLFELYFRHLNLYRSQARRFENSVVQTRRELLAQLKRTVAALEGTALTERWKEAKKLQDRWEKETFPDGFPESARAELAAEYDAIRTEMTARLLKEYERLLAQASALETGLQAVVEQVRSKTAPSLPQAARGVGAAEGEMQQLQRVSQQLPRLEESRPVLEKLEVSLARCRQLAKETRAAIDAEGRDRAELRHRLLLEAEALAVADDAEAARERLVDIRKQWESAGVLGTPRDAAYGLVFDHAVQVCAARDVTPATPAVEARRKELLFALEALSRFRGSGAAKAASALELPAGKVLELGMKYRQSLSLDPEAGLLKEVKKVMAEWAKLRGSSPEFPSFWEFYLDRLHGLLDLS